MAGEQDLEVLLASMHPVTCPGAFVMVALPEPPTCAVEALVREEEAVTVVVRQHVADSYGWNYDFVAAWITLRVHSSLDAVGLTAAVSTCLAAEGIAANMLAGYFHDHVLVPAERGDDALEALRRLAAR